LGCALARYIASLFFFRSVEGTHALTIICTQILPRLKSFSPRSRLVPAHRRGHHDQVAATQNERRRDQRPGHHDQVSREPKRGHGQQLAQGSHTQKVGTNSVKSRCSVTVFVVNSEPHTGARPSVRLCAGPELARCVQFPVSIFFCFHLYLQLS